MVYKYCKKKCTTLDIFAELRRQKILINSLESYSVWTTYYTVAKKVEKNVQDYLKSKAKINVFLFSFPLYSALTGSFSTIPIESFFFKSNFILAFEDNNYKASHCTLLSNFSWLWISKFGIQKRNFYWEYFLRPLFAAIICPYQLYRI